MSELGRKWYAGAVAGAVEGVITMPFEVAKTRAQISGRNSWQEATSRSWSWDSLRSAYHGLTPILLQTSVKVGIRFAMFDTLKRLTNSTTLAGLGAGAAEALVWIAPTERLKVLLINSRDTHSSLVRSVWVLARNQGVKGLWRGGTATVVRNSFTGAVRFTIYDKAVGLVATQTQQSPKDSCVALAAGFIAGAVTTVLNQPIDTVKTHMGADVVLNESPKYRSNLHCAQHILHTRGVHGFTAGLGARLVKISVGQAIIFAVYNRLQS